MQLRSRGLLTPIFFLCSFPAILNVWLTAHVPRYPSLSSVCGISVISSIHRVPEVSCYHRCTVHCVSLHPHLFNCCLSALSSTLLLVWNFCLFSFFLFSESLKVPENLMSELRHLLLFSDALDWRGWLNGGQAASFSQSVSAGHWSELTLWTIKLNSCLLL